MPPLSDGERQKKSIEGKRAFEDWEVVQTKGLKGEAKSEGGDA
jgi:hypothetical protein